MQQPASMQGGRRATHGPRCKALQGGLPAAARVPVCHRPAAAPIGSCVSAAAATPSSGSTSSFKASSSSSSRVKVLRAAKEPQASAKAARRGTLSADDVYITARSASPLVLEYQTSSGLLYIGVDGPLQTCKPGNGGLRIWPYPAADAAVAECRVLASTMSMKHSVFNTGFSGAKLVLNATDLPNLNKEELMNEVSTILHQLNGTVYTGCDLNTNMDDMELLTDLCPYVLASVGCLTDANDATGYGVFASIEGAATSIGGLEDKTVLVKGCGKVGGRVAQLLVQAGAKVLTTDVVKGRADIPGCVNVSDQDWRKIPCDILAPCSTSGFIDTHVAAMLKTRIIVGSSNAPFKDVAAQDVLETRGVTFIPESISSAGAVLADSIERFDAAAYRDARPACVYAYIESLIKGKTQELLDLAEKTGQVPSSLVDAICAPPASPPIGSFFSKWLEENTEETDVVVVGGGMAGTATSYWLSQLAPQMRGVVLEGRTVAHKGGSSYGDSRMYRQMYSQEYFSKMQSQALRMWAQLEQDTGVTLLKPHGLLFYGATDTGETVEGSVRGVQDTCTKLGLEHEYFADPEGMRTRWEQMEPGAGYEGVYEATAGSVNSSLACSTMMSQAQEKGWSLREHTRVEDVHVPEPGKVEVLTSAGKRIKAKKLVLCAGAWTNEVLQKMEGVSQLDLEVWNVHWGHYKVSPELAQSFPQWFCFQKEKEDSLDGGLYYGFPPETSDPVIKVGIDFTPNEPKFRTQGMSSFDYTPDERVAGLIDEFVAHNWAGVGERRDMQASPYTMTKDNYFVLDNLPGQPDVCLFTGGSGRAFKFAPLIGRCLADLVLGLPPSYDLSPLSATRDAVQLQPATEAESLAAAGEVVAAVRAQAAAAAPSSEPPIVLSPAAAAALQQQVAAKRAELLQPK